MDNTWAVRLVGGPFEGGEGRIPDPLPGHIWVRIVEYPEIMWFSYAEKNAEPYRLEESDEDNLTAVYVFEDQRLTDKAKHRELARA